MLKNFRTTLLFCEIRGEKRVSVIAEYFNFQEQYRVLVQDISDPNFEFITYESVFNDSNEAKEFAKKDSTR